jgi:hypothetical protein
LVEEARRRRQAGQSTTQVNPRFIRSAIGLGVVGLIGILMVAIPAVAGLVFLLGGVVLWACFAWLVARAAEAKGRDRTSFFLFAFFFSPLLMALIVACMAKPQASAAKANE